MAGGKKAEAPRVYVADLAAYNAGHLAGVWVELGASAEDNLEALNEAASRLLADSPVSGAEEIALHDYDGFGKLDLGEYESLENVANIASLIIEHGEVFAALIDHVGGASQLDEALRLMEEQYQGTYDSLEAWAEQYLDDTGLLAEVPSALRSYIDFESYARDVELSGDVFTLSTSDGLLHVFFGH